MAARFCRQCGSQIIEGNSFCGSCGKSTDIPEHRPRQTGQSYQTGPAYQPPPGYRAPQAYQAGRPFPAANPRTNTAAATGLIAGVFSLVIALILLVLVFILPSKEDFSLLALDAGAADYGLSSAAERPPAVAAAVGTYGQAPAEILARVNPYAVDEDYYGSYIGTVSFRNDNLELYAELTGDRAYSDILTSYNGKTYDCTAEMYGYLDVFSPEVYSENSDGIFYSEFLWSENGVSIYEDSDYDNELMCWYYVADKAYFLDDGSIYVITVMSAEFDDGRFIGNEIRLNLRRAS